MAPGLRDGQREGNTKGSSWVRRTHSKLLLALGGNSLGPGEARVSANEYEDDMERNVEAGSVLRERPVSTERRSVSTNWRPVSTERRPDAGGYMRADDTVCEDFESPPICGASAANVGR
jgi:hypothetical protein